MDSVKSPLHGTLDVKAAQEERWNEIRATETSLNARSDELDKRSASLDKLEAKLRAAKAIASLEEEMGVDPTTILSSEGWESDDVETLRGLYVQLRDLCQQQAGEIVKLRKILEKKDKDLAGVRAERKDLARVLRSLRPRGLRSRDRGISATPRSLGTGFAVLESVLLGVDVTEEDLGRPVREMRARVGELIGLGAEEIGIRWRTEEGGWNFGVSCGAALVPALNMMGVLGPLAPGTQWVEDEEEEGLESLKPCEMEHNTITFQVIVPSNICPKMAPEYKTRTRPLTATKSFFDKIEQPSPSNKHEYVTLHLTQEMLTSYTVGEVWTLLLDRTKERHTGEAVQSIQIDGKRITDLGATLQEAGLQEGDNSFEVELGPE